MGAVEADRCRYGRIRAADGGVEVADSRVEMSSIIAESVIDSLKLTIFR